MRYAGGAGLALAALLHLTARPGLARAEPPPASNKSPSKSGNSASSGGADPASANEPPRVRISYRAAPGCPDESAFVAALATQARAFVRAPRSAARVRALDAEISAHTEPSADGDAAGGSEHHAGQLRIREADGSTSERAVRGTTCAEVFAALTLVTALAIDTGPPPPRPPPSEEPPPPPPPPLPWGWSMALAGGGFFGMAPLPAGGFEPALELVPPLAGRPLAVRLGAAFAVSPRTPTEVGAAEFFWLVSRIGVGLWPLSLGWLSLRPTLGVDVGILRGRGFAVRNPHEQILPWVDIAFGGRARAAVTETFAFELAGGILVPFTRSAWTFDDPGVVVPVHETAPVGGYVTLGAAFTFGRPAERPQAR